MSPDELVAWLRGKIAAAEKRRLADNAVAASFTAKSARGLGVRPARAGDLPDGHTVWLLTLEQCRSMLKRAKKAIDARELSADLDGSGPE
jgi:hypothetical protein